jgi:hypothetical protein
MIGPADLHYPSAAPHFKTFEVFLICCLKCPKFQNHTKVYSKCSTLVVSSLNVSTIDLWKEFLSNAAVVTAIPNLTSRVFLLHLLSRYTDSWNIPHSPIAIDLSWSVFGMVALRFSPPSLGPVSIIAPVCTSALGLLCDSHYYCFFPHSFPLLGIFQFQLVSYAL